MGVSCREGCCSLGWTKILSGPFGTVSVMHVRKHLVDVLLSCESMMNTGQEGTGLSGHNLYN